MRQPEFNELTLEVRLCPGCGDVKPIYEFYRAWGDGWGTEGYYQHKCKVCTRKYQKNRRGLPKHIPSAPAHQQLIEALMSHGIWAVPGKSSCWKRLDVVAWGCIKIKVCNSTLTARGQYHFNTGKTKYWDEYDFAVLIISDREPSFYVFPADHAVFYNPLTGAHKKALGYTPNPAWNVETGRFGESLTSELMQEHRNRWSLIERKRLEIQDGLLSDSDVEAPA